VRTLIFEVYPPSAKGGKKHVRNDPHPGVTATGYHSRRVRAHAIPAPEPARRTALLG